MQNISMRNAGLEEAQAGFKIAGRNINNFRYADDSTQWQKVKKNQRVYESEGEEWKSWFGAQHSEN